MPEKITAESFMSNLVETLADSVQKQKSESFEEEISSVGARFNRLFGRQRPVHHVLGGGKSADVLLWRNKKISAGVLAAATAIWAIFEWLGYHFLTFVCFGLVLGMLAQFLWINASGLVNRSPAQVPRLVLPEEIFVNIGSSVGAEVNHVLQLLQDVSCGGTLKQFLVVLLLLTHYRSFMRGMKTKLTTLSTRYLTSSNTTTVSWMLVSSVRYPKESSGERNMTSLFSKIC
uniref:Reticulon-like protein n=1 Tax=Rhizophora mucronata TaxID=61149 RepID=A0A2P2KE52_RHIMU